ncbi:hypothetical protein GF389_03000 [Candidatus Dojkabacteria bacterium]|nr:hypothetical protein [Candidatus Dojkabacteria bacterium]
MPSQERDYARPTAIRDKSQYSLNEDMTYQSVKSHKDLFDSMDKYSGSKNLFGFLAVMAVVAASIGLGWSLSTTDKGGQDISVSSEECGDYQVKIYTSEGFNCQDCEDGAFGKLDLCEQESSIGECLVQEDGCFIPVE